MNSMQLQPIFDNLCRCFGHAVPTTGAAMRQQQQRYGQSGVTSDGHSRSVSASRSQSSSSNNNGNTSRRRANRLELNAKEYDALFEEGKRFDNSNNACREQPDDSEVHDHDSDAYGQGAHSHRKQSQVDQAKALAKAKLAANPSRYRSKRKRSGKSRDDIFRSRDATKATLESPACDNGAARQNQGTFSRLLNPSVALCFATPVRDSDEPDEIVLRSQDASDAGTLNTCEDTITSTLYFDAKYSHLVESQPPMPLFSQFKIGHQKDEIRTIIEQDTHSSLKMIRLFKEAHGANAMSIQRQQQQQQQQLRQQQRQHQQMAVDQQQQQHVPSSSTKVAKFRDVDMMDDLPDVKACSTDSSRRTDSSNQSMNPSADKLRT